MTINDAEYVHDLMEKRGFYQSVLRANCSHYIPVYVQLQDENGNIKQVELPPTVVDSIFKWLSEEVEKIEEEIGHI